MTRPKNSRSLSRASGSMGGCHLRFFFFIVLFSCSPASGTPTTVGSLSDLVLLREQVQRESICSLPGCPMVLERFAPLVKRAMSRGYVKDWHGRYVLDGFTHGFDLGARRELLHGTRVFNNYPTALAARDSISDAIESRVDRHKSASLGQWVDVKDALASQFGDYYIFPMGAVPKPHDPTVMRPTSDHTRTGFNVATVLGILGHSLDAYKQLEFLFSRNAWMTVADVDDAFSFIPLAPWLWAYMLFRWFGRRKQHPSCPKGQDNLFLYVHLFADFGTRGAPGTFKVILVDVFIGIARSEFVITIPLIVYVDDVAVISGTEVKGNAQMAEFQSFTSDSFGLGWKVAKELRAAQLQLYVGFWWDSRSLTRTLPELKLAGYLTSLLEAAECASLTLRDRQSLAGKMQRGIMTLPPGAACLLVNCYVLMSGLTLPWHRRRTTRAERLDYRFVHDLLLFNQGRGYYSYDGFDHGPEFRGDASKSRNYTGGGWVVSDGAYDYYTYGSSACRKPIDYLEGDTVLRCCAANAHKWKRMLIPGAIDNMAFEKSAEAGRSRVARLNDLLRGTFVLQLQHEFILQPYWIPSADNYLADALSRNREEEFLFRAYDFVEAGARLLRCADAGRTVTLADNDYIDAMSALRQLLRSYSSNYTGDGPVRGAGVGGDAQLLSIQYPYASIYEGCPLDCLDRLDELMDNRLRPSSLRKAEHGFARWSRFAAARGWGPLLERGDSARGGKMSSWIISLLDDTTLVFNSISTYVWGMRTMHVLQHCSDPAMGVEFYREFMRSIAVMSAVPGEPRKRVEFEVIDAILQDISANHWDDFEHVQLGLIILVLYFTFSRSECPCPKNFTGPESFDPTKHWQVADFKLRRSGDHWVLWVRFKAIKQDPRVERPQARHADPNLPAGFDVGGVADSKDWVPLGDVPGVPHFSVAMFFKRFVRLLGRAREDDEPMFLSQDQMRPYTYRALCSEFKAACVAHGGSERDAPHGLRVAGYYDSKRGNGVDLTVVHGGWSENSDAHSRYDRFPHSDVLGVPAGMLGRDSVFSSGAVRAISTVRPVRGSGTVRVPSGLVSPSDLEEDAAESGAQPLPSRGSIPEGYVRTDRTTDAGRTYAVYHAPDGTRFDSAVACWRHHSGSFAERADRHADGHAVTPGVDRSRLCNKPGPGRAVLCSLPQHHLGVCDFEASPVRLRARLA